jgi:uncharacterized peroxidase-related enzyme
MPFINTVDPEQASGALGEFYRAQQGSMDYLPNYARVFCHRPQVMQAWAELQRALRQELDERSYYLINLSAALALGSSYCALAHARKLLAGDYSTAELTAIVRGDADSPLTDAEKAMMKLARKVALNAPGVTQDDIDPLLESGLSDAAVFDIVAAAAGRCFFAKVTDALGASPDAALGELEEPLKTLLSTGGPIVGD